MIFRAFCRDEVLYSTVGGGEGGGEGRTHDYIRPSRRPRH